MLASRPPVGVVMVSLLMVSSLSVVGPTASAGPQVCVGPDPLCTPDLLAFEECDQDQFTVASGTPTRDAVMVLRTHTRVEPVLADDPVEFDVQLPGQLLFTWVLQKCERSDELDLWIYTQFGFFGTFEGGFVYDDDFAKFDVRCMEVNIPGSQALCEEIASEPPDYFAAFAEITNDAMDPSLECEGTAEWEALQVVAFTTDVAWTGDFSGQGSINRLEFACSAKMVAGPI